MEPSVLSDLEETRQAIGTAEISRESIEVGGGIASFSGPGSWNSQACGLGFRGPVSGADIDRLVAFYTERGVEPRIEVCPYADGSLLEALRGRCFEVREFESVFVIYARAGMPTPAVAPDEAIELRRVDPRNAEVVRTWVEVSTRGFRPAGERVPELLAETCTACATHPRSVSHIAYIDGQPVGGSGMEIADARKGGRVACLFGTSVAEPYRRRGVQTALMLERVRVAFDAGCDAVCIHSKPGIPTERNARRLGFELAYTKITMAMPGEGLVASP